MGMPWPEKFPMHLVTAPQLPLRLPRLLLPLLAFASACSGSMDNPVGYCLAPASIAIEADVTDSVSGLSRADSATGFVQSGSSTDTLWHSPPSSLLYGGSKLGTYDVTITRPGYLVWTRSGVSVTRRGQCGNVIPVHLAARLQPSP
jgi:hypothetical protein